MLCALISKICLIILYPLSEVIVFYCIFLYISINYIIYNDTAVDFMIATINVKQNPSTLHGYTTCNVTRTVKYQQEVREAQEYFYVCGYALEALYEKK